MDVGACYTWMIIVICKNLKKGQKRNGSNGFSFDIFQLFVEFFSKIEKFQIEYLTVYTDIVVQIQIMEYH